MTIDAGLKPEGAPERSPIAGAGAPSGVDAGPRRYSVQRKMAVVARCADFLVERGGFEPVTSAVRAPRARRLRRFQGLLPRAPQDPTLDRRRLHLPFAAQGRVRRHRRRILSWRRACT